MIQSRPWNRGENRFRLPLNSINRQFESIKLFNPSIKHFDLKERTIPVSHTPSTIVNVFPRRYLCYPEFPHPPFSPISRISVYLFNQVVGPLYGLDVRESITRPVSPSLYLVSIYIGSRVIGNEKSDRVSFFSFSLTPSLFT